MNGHRGADTDNLPKQQHEKFWIEARCVSLHKLFLIITHQIVVSTATEMITFPPLDKKQMKKMKWLGLFHLAEVEV